MQDAHRDALAPVQPMNQVDAQRARSLGRSRSRGRVSGTPSELLARKQQLLSSSAQLDSAWTQAPEVGAGEQHRRSNVRRAAQHSPPAPATPTDEAGRLDASLRVSGGVEAKLESLSELLKSHQNETNGLGAGDGLAAKSIDDVYILLAKKEKDLQLAAELGKVLLEKNDELSKANERITEEYSHKLEVSQWHRRSLRCHWRPGLSRELSAHTAGSGEQCFHVQSNASQRSADRLQRSQRRPYRLLNADLIGTLDDDDIHSPVDRTSPPQPVTATTRT